MKRAIKFKLRNYQGKLTEFSVEVPLSETNLTIVYLALSGDEIVKIYHCNELLNTYDSDTTEDRRVDLLDEIKLLTVEDLEKLNKTAE